MIKIKERMCEVRTGDVIMEDIRGGFLGMVTGINPLIKVIAITGVEDETLYTKNLSFDDFIRWWNQNELLVLEKESYTSEWIRSIIDLIPDEMKEQE